MAGRKEVAISRVTSRAELKTVVRRLQTDRQEIVDNVQALMDLHGSIVGVGNDIKELAQHGKGYQFTEETETLADSITTKLHTILTAWEATPWSKGQ